MNIETKSTSTNLFKARMVKILKILHTNISITGKNYEGFIDGFTVDWKGTSRDLMKSNTKLIILWSIIQTSNIFTLNFN